MKYLIADLVVEFTPKFEELKHLAEPFMYFGERAVDIEINCSQEYIEHIFSRMEHGSTLENAENFAYASAFNKNIIKYDAMLVHSSAIVYEGKAYLFSADSGVGKSTHTKLWKKAFGDDVQYINDDKPVIKIVNGSAIAFGTPFDGGSGIANNLSAPLGAIVFLARGEKNTIRKAEQSEIIKNLYFQTARFLGRQSAEHMLNNFDLLIGCTDFYIMECNTDISSAYIAKDEIVK